MTRVVIDDPSLSVHDVMDILGVSKSFAYEVMAKVGVERLAKKCIRVRKSALEAWRKEQQEECASPSTYVAASIGHEELKTGSSSGSRRSTRANGKRGSSRTDGNENSLIPTISVRTKRRSPAPQSGG